MKKVLYVKPEIEVVQFKDHLMLDNIGIHESFVDDEAAKQGNYDNEIDWDSQESIWGKPSGNDQNWDKWSDN
jgi:hypothetical protein